MPGGRRARLNDYCNYNMPVTWAVAVAPPDVWVTVQATVASAKIAAAVTEYPAGTPPCNKLAASLQLATAEPFVDDALREL